jgi:hypothetical protein
MQLTWNPPKLSTTKAKFVWSADYSAEVHEGEVYLGGRSIGRPWTDISIGRFQLEESFKSHFDGDLSKAFEKTMENLSKDFDDVIDNYDWGIPSNNQKQYRNAPTWQTITDSGQLRDSQSLSFE